MFCLIPSLREKKKTVGEYSRWQYCDLYSAKAAIKSQKEKDRVGGFARPRRRAAIATNQLQVFRKGVLEDLKHTLNIEVDSSVSSEHHLQVSKSNSITEYCRLLWANTVTQSTSTYILHMYL